MDRRLLDWFRRRTTPYTADVFAATSGSSPGGGGPPPPGAPFNPSGPPVDVPGDPPGGNPFDPSGPPVDVPGDSPGGPFDPSPPADGVPISLQTPGPGIDRNEYTQEQGSTPAAFTDGFDNALIDRWLTVVRGAMTEGGGKLSVDTLETANTPRVGALFIAKSYTDKLSEATLDDVMGKQYVLGRMTAAGNGYAVELNGAGSSGNLKILSLTGWVATTLLTVLFPPTFAAGDRLGISIVGTAIKAFKNGVLAGIAGTTNATYASGYSGLGGDTIGQAWRDFRVS